MEKTIQTNTLEENLKILEEDFVPVTAPDVKAIAEMVKQAKGKDRSMKEFAEATGISAPTLSRIVNEKITQPLSIRTIYSIIDHQAEDSNVNLFIFAGANGYMSKMEASVLHKRRNLSNTKKETYKQEKELMGLIIKAALLERGGSMDRETIDSNASGGLKCVTSSAPKYDMELAADGNNEHYEWVFYLIPFNSDMDFDSKQKLETLTSQLIMQLSPVFLTDAWLPQEYKNYKISFCFSDKDLYKEFTQVVEKSILHNRFSTCLIDTENLLFISETELPSLTFPDFKSAMSLPVIKPLKDFPSSEVPLMETESEIPGLGGE